MRIFSYHNKRLLRRTLLIILLAVLLIAAVVICRFIYLARFIRYDDTGAHLDYSQDLTPVYPPTGGEPETEEEFPFDTVIVSSDSVESEPLQKLHGYYITASMLAEDVQRVRDALNTLQDCNAIMIDVKSVFGNFYYSSKLAGATMATVDIDAVDALIRDLLAMKDVTVIARIPAFSDPNYALAHQTQGLPLYTGALWTDENGCYWLNPYSNDVQAWVSTIAIELSNLGFDEVLIDDFRFPDSDRISWNDPSVTPRDAILDAADVVSANLTGYRAYVAFGTDDPEIAAFCDRAYITCDDPAEIGALLSAMEPAVENAETELVFLTASHDTRFDVCGVLRPLLEE